MQGEEAAEQTGSQLAPWAKQIAGATAVPANLVPSRVSVASVAYLAGSWQRRMTAHMEAPPAEAAG